MCIGTKSLEESLQGAIRTCIEGGLRAGNSFYPDLKPLVLSSRYLDQILELFVRSMVEKDIEPDVVAGTGGSAALVGGVLTTSTVLRGFVVFPETWRPCRFPCPYLGFCKEKLPTLTYYIFSIYSL